MKMPKKFISNITRFVLISYFGVSFLFIPGTSFGNLLPQKKEFPDWDVVGAASAPLLSKSTADSETIYQALFEPREAMQWKGYLKKFKFNPDADTFDTNTTPIGAYVKETDRQIYTPATGLTEDAIGGNLVFFKVSNDETKNDALADMMGIAKNDGYHKNFINWLRGETNVGAIGTDYHHLFDIYHSGLVKVGPPNAGIIKRGSEADYVTSFKDPNSSRETVIYVQSNAGLLHCFIDGDVKLEEKWAFLPPNVRDGHRLIGLKSELDKKGIPVLDKDKINIVNYMPSIERQSEENKSNQLLLADGPVLAEDVLFSNGEYRTVLLGLLGFGGRGMYALDVTAPVNPKFLWAVENSIKKNDSNVIYWKGKDAKKINEIGFGYQKLSFTGSSPFIGFYYADEAKTQRKWVFIIGNGQYISGNAGIGKSAIYISEIETGKIIKVLKTKDNGTIVTPIAVSLERRNENENYEPRLIKYFYVGDYTGSLYRADISDHDYDKWSETIPAFFKMETQAGLSYSLDVAKLKNAAGVEEDWVFCGTGDLEGYQEQNPNQANFFAAINTTAIGQRIGKLNNLLTINSDNPPTPNPQYGWKLDFKIDKVNYESLATPPVVIGGKVYFSTQSREGDLVRSRLYALDARTGEGLWLPAASSKTRFIEFTDTIISGISLAGNRIAVSVTYKDENAAKQVPYGFHLFGDNLLYGNLEDAVSGVTDPTEKYKNMTPLYWKTR